LVEAAVLLLRMTIAEWRGEWWKDEEFREVLIANVEGCESWKCILVEGRCKVGVVRFRRLLQTVHVFAGGDLEVKSLE
jgi:hypothetical protein